MDYVLICAAFRMAQATGLHRRVPRGQDLSREESDKRNRLFWSIYCIEKHFAFSQGLDSVGLTLIWQDLGMLTLYRSLTMIESPVRCQRQL